MATNIIDAISNLESGKTLTVTKNPDGSKTAHKVTLGTTASTLKAEKQNLIYKKCEDNQIVANVNDVCFMYQACDGNYGLGNEILNTPIYLPYIEQIKCEAFGNGYIASSAYGGPQFLTLPNCSEICTQAFYYGGPLSISLPECDVIGYNAFEHSGLEYINCPKVNYIQSGAFINNDDTLRTVILSAEETMTIESVTVMASDIGLPSGCTVYCYDGTLVIE